jgi:hypothetical protein
MSRLKPRPAISSPETSFASINTALALPGLGTCIHVFSRLDAWIQGQTATLTATLTATPGDTVPPMSPAHAAAYHPKLVCSPERLSETLASPKVAMPV